MALTFGSLFAGVGGFDMGFEQAGWDCKFQVEWDKNCQQILNKHWPDVPKWLDVSDVNGAEIPPVDCIIFGSPCQDLSVAGKRAGLEGERSGLFHEAVRIIKEMRDATNGTYPRWTVWENVAGALSSNNGRDFGTVINEMAKAGAHLQEYAVLDAQHFGIPQRRRRVFLASCFDPATAERCPDPLLPVRESLRGDTKKGRSKGKDTADETTTSVKEHSYLTFDTQFGSNANVFKDQIPTLKATQQPPSVTQAMKVRRLTPLECEKLMGWPDDHTRWKADGTEQADSHRYRQCGNGVASPVAQWVAQQIGKVEYAEG
jgi:DNA (cytosine-5)-methyltransferase 1